MWRRGWGIVRSLVMYHGIPGRQRRMRQFYRQFLPPGELGFDVGAHVGSRVRAWRGLDVHVVAIEPQPDCLKVLRLWFGRDRQVHIHDVAVGAEPGVAQLAISRATPTVSSMSREWIAAAGADHRFAKVRWDRCVEVQVTTLDELISKYGVPAFTKIDVEGFEVDVLRGLSTPLPALSFEYLPAAHDQALEALELVAALADYVYNYSPIETMSMVSEKWLNSDELVAELKQRRPLGRSGDVYAKLRAAEPPR